MSRDERGATAILMAVASTMLFGVAAMAVDLGNGFVRDRDVQLQADFTALAGGRELPGPKVVDETHPAVVAAAEFLNRNRPQNDRQLICGMAAAPITPNDLLDGKTCNGEVEISRNNIRMKVTGPPALVDFGLAGALGFDSVPVQRSATLQLGTPGKVLPYFVGESCSWGTQTIVDPANGLNDKKGQPVLLPAGSNGINLTFTSSSTATPLNPTPPAEVVLTQTSSSGFDKVTKVGFTLPGSPGAHHEVTVADDEKGTDGAGSPTITVTVPAAVSSQKAIWYIRVYSTHGSGGWSKEYIEYAVGNPGLYCVGSNDGNFGSLRMPRNDSTSMTKWVARNTAMGVQHSLGPFPEPATGDYPEPCNGSVGAVLVADPPDPNRTVNCLQTETGLVSALTTGLISGDTSSDGYKGLLDVSGGSGRDTVCGSNRTGVNWSGHGGPWTINNDYLSCFFENDTVTVAEVSGSGYTGPQVISKDVFDSPRFFFIPVLSSDPNEGTGYWPIIEFRPAFLTGELPISSRDNVQLAADGYNGIKIDNSNGIEWIEVVLINDNALPETIPVRNGGIIPYVGNGPKVLQLIQ